VPTVKVAPTERLVGAVEHAPEPEGELTKLFTAIVFPPDVSVTVPLEGNEMA